MKSKFVRLATLCLAIVLVVSASFASPVFAQRQADEGRVGGFLNKRIIDATGAGGGGVPRVSFPGDKPISGRETGGLLEGFSRWVGGMLGRDKPSPDVDRNTDRNNAAGERHERGVGKNVA